LEILTRYFAVCWRKGCVVADIIDRARMRSKGQVTLSREVRRALHLEEGDEVEFIRTEAGDILVRGLATIPTDQRWFWTEEWQAGEREASAQIAAGQLTSYKDADSMFADLDG
jgi:antitoxin PrlF